MLRRPILALGIGLMIAGYALLVASARGRAAEPAQASGHEAQVKAEAEPGHAAAESHAAEGEEKPNPMKPEPTLAIWTVLVFLGLLFLLTKFAWGPLSHALHQREEHLEHCLLQTEKARNESEQLLAEHRRLMAQADDRVEGDLRQGAARRPRPAGKRSSSKLRRRRRRPRDRAQREIATARDQALAEIWSQTANVAVSVAGRVLTKQLDANEHRRLLDLAIQELPAAPASGNGHGGTHG